ncbi:MAG: oxidoreductase [Planctomycetota bacterium]|nr:MAG: oxidoreductase [Planctomycetota bacterium]
MSGASPLRVGVVGLGFMGATHVRAYLRAERAGVCRLVAVCDRSPQRTERLGATGGNLDLDVGAGETADLRSVRRYTDAAALLADAEVDAVSVCTHTPTHVELSIAAVRAGKHVLVEKPVAIRSAEVERLIAAVAGSGRVVMPAMCMRFWPGWTWLKERIADGGYGRVQSAVFRRLGSAPTWAPEFYGDAGQTGGVMFDLHLHDADFIRWCFGAPEAVCSAGDGDHVTTLYRYERGPAHVVAEAGWRHAPGFGFRMQYVVRFETATAEFDLSKSPPLTLHRDGRQEAINLPDEGGYDGEVRHFIDAVRSSTSPVCTLEDARVVTRLLEAEVESLRGNAVIKTLSQDHQGGAK